MSCLLCYLYVSLLCLYYTLPLSYCSTHTYCTVLILRTPLEIIQCTVLIYSLTRTTVLLCIGKLDKLVSKCCAPGCVKTAQTVAAEKHTLGEQKIKSLLLCSKCRVAKYCSRVRECVCVCVNCRVCIVFLIVTFSLSICTIVLCVCVCAAGVPIGCVEEWPQAGVQRAAETRCCCSLHLHLHYSY